MNDGFVSHRKSNEIDLKIKYDYLYTLSSKVFSEAKMLMVKRKVDPDRTMMSYLREPVDIDHEYVLDSDYSSDSDIEKNLDVISDLDEEDISKLDISNEE